MIAHSEIFGHSGLDKSWLSMIALSALCHLLLFSGMVFLPDLRLRRPSFPASVEIDLVSLPSGAPKAPQAPAPAQKGAPKAEPIPAKPAPKAPAPPKKPEKTVQSQESLAPKGPLPVKRSEKKKEFDPSKAIDNAIAKIEKQVPESRPQSVLEAIDALRKKTEETGGSGAASGSGVGFGMGEATKRHLELLDIYHAEIWDVIKRNWAYSEELDRGRDNPEAIIIVKIMRDGEIRDIWFEQRSGSSYFDDSCLKAVKKSNPLPPLPEGFLNPFHEVGLRFNPRDLRMGRP